MNKKYIYGIIVTLVLIIIALLIVNYNLENSINGLELARHNCDSLVDKSVQNACYKIWGLD